MAAKKTKRVYHRIKKHVHKPGKPSLLSMLGATIPQLVVNTGQTAVGGNNVFASGLSISDRLRFLASNESMLFVAYDPIVNKIEAAPAAFNYAFLLAPRILRMFFGPKRFGKISIW